MSHKLKAAVEIAGPHHVYGLQAALRAAAADFAAGGFVAHDLLLRALARHLATPTPTPTPAHTPALAGAAVAADAEVPGAVGKAVAGLRRAGTPLSAALADELAGAAAAGRALQAAFAREIDETHDPSSLQ